MNKQQQERYDHVGHMLALLEELREVETLLLRAQTRSIFFGLRWGPKAPNYSIALERISDDVGRVTDHLVTQVQLEARPTTEDGIDVLQLKELGPDKPA